MKIVLRSATQLLGTGMAKASGPADDLAQSSASLHPLADVLQGVSEQLMVQVVAPAVKPLVSDRASAVKEQCFTAVAGWLGASRSALHAGSFASAANQKGQL